MAYSLKALLSFINGSADAIPKHPVPVFEATLENEASDN